jgi:hypothetical protein
LGDDWLTLSKSHRLSTHFLEIFLALTVPNGIFCKTARKLNSSEIKTLLRVKFSRIARETHAPARAQAD